MRDVVQAQVEARREEERRVEIARRRQARDERAEKRRQSRTQGKLERKTRMLKAQGDANERVERHVDMAARSLRAALRSATEVKFPRHSEIGRDQQRTVRRLQAAMAALRGLGNSPYGGDADFEIDDDLE
jgi:hypothetical protein